MMDPHAAAFLPTHGYLKREVCFPMVSQSAATSSASMGPADRHFAGYIFELDGTLYLGEELIPGARRLIEALVSLDPKSAVTTAMPAIATICHAGSRPTTHASAARTPARAATTRKVNRPTDRSHSLSLQ